MQNGSKLLLFPALTGRDGFPEALRNVRFIKFKEMYIINFNINLTYYIYSGVTLVPERIYFENTKQIF